MSSFAIALNSTFHDGLAEAVSSCNVAKPYLPTLNGCEKNSSQSTKILTLVPYADIGFVMLVRDAEELSQAFVLKRLYSSSYLNQECLCLVLIDEEAYDQ